VHLIPAPLVLALVARIKPLYLAVISTESVIAWPESDVPAARNVMGTSSSSASKMSCAQSWRVHEKTRSPPRMHGESSYSHT
jgi:hypothetical protein